jgi:hypothetical protein
MEGAERIEVWRSTHHIRRTTAALSDINGLQAAAADCRTTAASNRRTKRYQ